MKNRLLQVSAAVESGAGAALLLVPSMFVGFLIGSTLDSTAALIVARLAGTALVTLGLICWFASRDFQSRAADGVIVSLALYNTAAVAILLFALLGANLSGPGIWPAIVGHAALAAWCLACLRKEAVSRT